MRMWIEWPGRGGLGFLFVLGLWARLGLQTGFGQAVAVVAEFDPNPVAPGGLTTLHVRAQVVPDQRTNAAGIFSWYVDVLNARPAMATANYDAMLRPLSDRDPLLSSPGANSGVNRVGIYDTFLNRPGAGVNTPVELLSIPVRASTTAGVGRIQVLAGSGVPDLTTDFLVDTVDPKAAPLMGGNYSLAAANLMVCNSSRLNMQRQPGVGGTSITTFQFTPCPDVDHYVDATSDPGGVWAPLPGAPHNTGTLTVTNGAGTRFFRLRFQPK